MSDGQAAGISAGNRFFFVALAFFAALILVPNEPHGMVVRILGLIAIPSFVWLAITYSAKWLKMSAVTNVRLARTIGGAITALLLVGAYSSFTSDFHEACTAHEMTRDGQECVGDYVTVEGPDRGQGIMLIMLAAFAGWISVFAKSDED